MRQLTRPDINMNCIISGKKNKSPLAILTKEEHRGKGNVTIWNTLTDGFDNPSSQSGWSTIKRHFWKDYAKQVVNGGI